MVPLLVGSALALAALIVPGWLVAWGLGIQGALRFVVAPAFSLGIWAGATWIAIGLQLPWRAWLVLPLLALVILPFMWGRLMTMRPGVKSVWPLTPQTRLTRGWWVVGVTCAGISGLPYLLATRGGKLVAQTWDVVFHLSAIRYTREYASASPWVSFAPLNGGAEVYYPNIFHNVVALLPGEPVAVYTAITLVMLVLWPLVMGAFTLLAVVRVRGATAESYFMSSLSMLGAAMGVNFPTLAVANFATPPYTLALVATPGVVILGVTIHRLRPGRMRLPQLLYSAQLAPWMGLGLVVGVAGVSCTHPASVFNLLVFLGVPFLVHTVRWLVRWRVRRYVKVLVVTGSLLVAALVFHTVLWAKFASMSKFANPNNDIVLQARRLLSDYSQDLPVSPFRISGLLISLAAFYGMMVLHRAGRLKWMTWGFIVAWGLYLLAAGPVWPGYFLTVPWYLQFSRLAPLVSTFGLPLAAYGFMSILESFEAFCVTRGWDFSLRQLRIALLGVLLVTSCGATIPCRTDVISASYNPKQIMRGTMLTQSERNFMHREAPVLPPNAVIWGAPYEGTVYWWILEGKRVVFPSLSWPHDPALKVMRDLWDGSISEKSCRYLKKLGVTHYYVDTDRRAAGARYQAYRWLWHEKKVSFKLPASILTPVAENPSMSGQLGEFVGQRLYEVNLDACSKTTENF